MSLKLPTLACVFALLLLAACGDESKSWNKVKDTSGATWDALKTWSAEKSGEAKRALAKKMEELQPQLMVAREAAKLGGEAAAKEFEQKVADAKVAFGLLKNASAATWAEALAGFKRAYTALTDKIESLTS